MTDPATLLDRVTAEVGRVLVGNEHIVEGLAIALLTRRHVLLEGVPGVAKTTIATLFARTLGFEYRRVQMTPDLLPADVIGTRIYRAQTGEFDLQKGPIFSNVVVVDEINRATPKTQSALLEAMQERQVTIEGETLSVPSPFMIVATQNPIEMEGTFGLPEAQRDRFLMKLRVDIPDRTTEASLLDAFNADHERSASDVGPVVDSADIEAARAAVGEVFVTESVRDYVLDIVDATRTSADIAHGASPRAAIALLHATKARAAIRDRAYAIPDDTKALATQVLAHRLVLSTEAELSDVVPEDIVGDVVDATATPTVGEDEIRAAAAGNGGESITESGG